MYPSSPPSSPPSLASSLSWSREPSPMPLGDADDSGWQHPFSATSRAGGLKPPRYDLSHAYRKLVTPPDTPPKATTSSTSDDVDMRDEQSSVVADDDDDIDLSDDGLELGYDQVERDAEIWRDAVSQAVDETNPHVDLSKSGLRYIDPQVGDLGALVVLGNGPVQLAEREAGFSRVDSAATEVPISRVSSQRRLFQRTVTRSSGLSLYLGHNEISVLPLELFTLHQLVVLSLDGNQLRQLPGAISQLKALKELNVARNLLRTLPAELDQLKLDRLLVIPNSRFLKRTSTSDQLETIEQPSLFELALRVFCAPGRDALRTELHAEYQRTYGVPLPPPIQPFLEPTVTDAANCARFNVCAAHGQCFVRPGHTRVEFRNILAGVRLTEPVPVLLRGCVPGCLDVSAAPAGLAIGEEDDDDDDDFMEGLGERVL
ncbi:hypothetical protein EXIGLDRAFT_836747, partial [Exidia glandulosa HHB12029]